MTTNLFAKNARDLGVSVSRAGRRRVQQFVDRGQQPLKPVAF